MAALRDARVVSSNAGVVSLTEKEYGFTLHFYKNAYSL